MAGIEESKAYPELNRRWKIACKVVLGGEVGELSDFAGWLYENNGPRITAFSEKSKKPVVAYEGFYSKNARWLSFDEIDFSARPPSLDINQIKDIDSILEGISEIAVYAGNIWLGDSSFVEDSTTVVDSHFVYHSESVWSSKYVAFTSHVIGEYVFGGHAASTNFLIRCNCIHCERCFEVSRCDTCFDIYYSHGLSGCHECMFSFNLRSKNYRIGNLELPKEKYFSIKQKLIAEMREKLKKEKRLPHHIDLFKSHPADYSKLKEQYLAMPPVSQKKEDKSVIEKAFSQTTRLVLGKEYAGIDKYAEWLMRNTRKFEKGQSCASKKPLLIPNNADFFRFPRDRLLAFEEAEFLGERLSLSKEEVEQLSMENAAKLLSKIAFFSPDWKSGNNSNNICCPIEFNSTDCYYGIGSLFGKKCAFGWWPRWSECLFGYNLARSSAFSINVFSSEKVQRCFEVLEARNCTGCYYCHNVENVHDSMFCFNTKNKKYAIANVELPREKFLQIKANVLSQLNDELSEKNSIELSIFNIPDFLGRRK